MFSGNETVSIKTGSFLHKHTINLNERKCYSTPPKLPLAFPFFPALRITFYRLTNEITDEINQSEKSLLCLGQIRSEEIVYSRFMKIRINREN